MQKIKRTALLALSVTLALAGASYAQVIDKLPADALVVVKVSNLTQTSTKIAKLAEALGINAFVPQLNDPLGELKKQLKISGGLKDDGELAFAYLDPKTEGAGGDEGKSMLILVPTTDYKALVGNIEGATTDGAVTVTKGSDGQDMFIADWDGYAAVSPIRSLIEKAPSATLKLPARAAKEMGAVDLGLYANFEKLRGPLTADLEKNKDKNRTQMLDQMKAQGQVPEKFQPAMAAAFDQAYTAFSSFLRDTDAATVGFTIGEKGVHENVVAEFKEGSYLGKATADLKNNSDSLLNSLPLGKYLVYGGFAFTPKVVNQLIDDVTGPIIKELPSDEDLKGIPDYIASVKSLVENVKEQSFGMIAPQGAIGQEGIIQVVGSMKGDGDKIIASFKDVSEKGAKLTNSLVGAAQGIEMKQDYAAAAKEIDGVKFDSVTTEILGDTPAANQQRQMMQVLYGGPKVEAYVGNTGEGVLSYVGASEDTVKALIAAAKGKESPLAGTEPVKSTTSELPKARIAEAYVQVDEIVAFALRAANQFGFTQANIQMPPDLQPVGISLSSEGSALELHYYITNDLLQALVSAGIQLQQAMQGGGGRPGGGL